MVYCNSGQVDFYRRLIAKEWVFTWTCEKIHMSCCQETKNDFGIYGILNRSSI